FDLQSSMTLTASGTTNLITNAGTLRKSGTGTTSINVTVTNTGTFEVQSGTLNLAGAFTNFSSATSTLTDGTYLVSGTFQFAGANISTTAATIVPTGRSSRIINTTGVTALANFMTNPATASFALQGGHALSTSRPFGNAGTLLIAGGSSFTTTGAYTQTG